MTDIDSNVHAARDVPAGSRFQQHGVDCHSGDQAPVPHNSNYQTFTLQGCDVLAAVTGVLIKPDDTFSASPPVPELLSVCLLSISME